MYTYTSHGLSIHSTLRLPQLPASGNGRPEVVIRLGEIDRCPPETGASGRYVEVASDEAYLHWEHAGSYLVEQGRTITIDPLPDADEALLRLPLLGPVLGVLLHQRGRLVLHASAVAIEGQAVGFIGEKGWGKSTTAATLHRRGHPLVTDDMLAIELNEQGGPQALPGFPQLKLWPDAAEASLGEDPETLPLLHHLTGTKRARAVTGEFSTAPRPLTHIFVLGKGDSTAIEALNVQEAFAALIRHTYGHTFMDMEETTASYFSTYAELVQKSTILRLQRLPSLDDLPQIAHLVEEELLDRTTGT